MFAGQVGICGLSCSGGTRPAKGPWKLLLRHARARDLKALPSTPLLHGLEAYTAPWERRKRALSAPAFRSSFTHSASPRNAAKWSGARPRLFGRGFEGGGRLGGPPFRRELRSGKDPKNGRRSRCPKPRRAHNCSAVHFLLGFLCLEAACYRRYRYIPTESAPRILHKTKRTGRGSWLR